MNTSRQYKVGDAVWFHNSRSSFSAFYIHCSMIVRITPGGKICLENGKEFKNGNQVKTRLCSYPVAFIIEEERAKEELKREEDRARRASKVNALLKAIENKRARTNIFFINDEQEAAIEALTSLLTYQSNPTE